MKQILPNQNYADISVTHVLRIDVVQQIIKDHEAWFATTITTKILRFTLVICGVGGQQLTRRNSGLLTITPDYASAKITFGAEGVDFL